MDIKARGPCPSLSIERATSADIPFIMSVERLPGYAGLVGTYDAGEHERRIAAPNTIHLLCNVAATPVGFAVVRFDDDGMGNAQLHRIAVASAGRGYGTAFLRQICHQVFSNPEIGRLWLDLLPSNGHARYIYGKVGFAEEGTMRRALRLEDGKRVDLLLMAIIREEWKAIDTRLENRR